MRVIETRGSQRGSRSKSPRGNSDGTT
jgi:hypothetical protein